MSGSDSALAPVSECFHLRAHTDQASDCQERRSFIVMLACFIFMLKPACKLCIAAEGHTELM